MKPMTPLPVWTIRKLKPPTPLLAEEAMKTAIVRWRRCHRFQPRQRTGARPRHRFHSTRVGLVIRTKLPHHAPSQAASDIIHPASTETRNLRCCERAGQVRSRLHDDDSAAGRTFSRPGRGNVATLKPMTPLHPLMQANVKPPSPLLAPEQQPLKPVTPLQPKNTLKTPISHPQR